MKKSPDGGLREGFRGTSLSTVGRTFSGLNPLLNREVLCQPCFSTSSKVMLTERVVVDSLSVGGFQSERLPVSDACHMGRRSLGFDPSVR